ncbi:MAG: ABC transporter ATP-binding protein [Hyphomicrobiales bacterium]
MAAKTTKKKPAAARATKRKTAKKKPARTAVTPASSKKASGASGRRPAPRASVSKEKAAKASAQRRISGYGAGGVDAVISVDEVTRQVARIAQQVTVSKLDSLCKGEPYVRIDNLRSGYGQMQILHDLNLRVGKQQSLCLIGPNGAGKSTILHSIFGFNTIFSGHIFVGQGKQRRDITTLSSSQKLKEAGIAYILQDKSVFPNMTVEENLWMGGYLMDQPQKAKDVAERVFDKYPRLAARRRHLAKVLSGGERRLLEISRALVMEPEVLLVDEPSIGLEPRFIDMVFEILNDLQHTEGKTIIMVEQNAKKGLEFADIGYVLVSGEVAIAGKGKDLLSNPEVGRLFLGG